MGLAYDETFSASGQPREAAQRLFAALRRTSARELADRRLAAEAAVRAMGITFTVYSEGRNVDRAWPFDVLPRVMSRTEWAGVEAGLVQRVAALNAFVADVYGEQRILHDGLIPAELVLGSVNFRPQCVGATPVGGIWAHICGSDLIRDADGTVYVLEDNLRVPSGVAYMLENRLVTKRVWPELFSTCSILPVDDYPAQLYETLCAAAQPTVDSLCAGLLTPGIHNSAYFEHTYLAQQMGVELVEGGDLFVGDDDYCYMRTIDGPERVDVLYRRIDDLFLDPELFRPDSLLGVRGAMRAWRAGKLALVNAPGCGVADDKAIYAYVPAMIRYYLAQEPLLSNVPTFLCHDPKQCRHVLSNLEKLVVKPANESGGYGMLVGPRADAGKRAEFAERIRANPRDYVAQPTLTLSVAPTLTTDGVEPRHLDLRPFVLSRPDSTYVTTGGLTRVALVRGSLVVNSSQGGGSKDTWIVDTGGA